MYGSPANDFYFLNQNSPNYHLSVNTAEYVKLMKYIPSVLNEYYVCNSPFHLYARYQNR